MKLKRNNSNCLLPSLPKHQSQNSISNINKITKRPSTSFIDKNMNANLIISHKKTLKLNPDYYNIHSRKWFKHKFHQTQIVNSINNLIPQTAEHIKRNHSYQDKPTQSLPISLKYLFPVSTYNKIMKLRELFIDFDMDTNQRMELGEIETMFNVNHIKVSKSDLLSLFFQKPFNINKANDKKKMYLSFEQFITFCLGRDQEFRLFMRELKARKDNNIDNEFFPMNFNALLDYFINKGDKRKAQKKIEGAIETMKTVLSLKCYNLSDNNESNQSDGIDFHVIMNEFEKLFLLTQSTIDVNKKKRARSTKDNQKQSLTILYKPKPLFKNCKTLFGSIPKVNIQNNGSCPALKNLQASKTLKNTSKDENSFYLSQSGSSLDPILDR